ncbi:MAG: hypothetical protein IPF93_14975 [Saprospiraceae bacterium]|nr:hypothetical protein [Saprospiraceae bacterium]
MPRWFQLPGPAHLTRLLCPMVPYKAKVCTVCGSGYSSWTSEVIFTINYASHPPCAKPIICYFPSMVPMPLFRGRDGSQYQIELENTDKNVMVNNDIMAGTIFQSTLAPGTYRCRVKSKCPPDWSDWCDYGWFTIQGDHPIPGPGSPLSTCAAPAQLFPSVALHDVTLSWSGSVDQYQLQAENRVTGEAVISAGLNTKSYLATLPNGGYHYRVRSQCGNDYRSGVPGQSSLSMLQVLWSPPRTRYLSSCSYRTILRW